MLKKANALVKALCGVCY